MLRDSVLDKQICENQNNVLASDSTSYERSQTLFGVLIDDIQDLELPAVVSLLRDKIVAPDVILVRWPQPNARAIGEPKSGSLGLLLRNLQSFILPDSVDAVPANLKTLHL